MIQPTGDNVLLKMLKDEVSKGGIILPGNREIRINKGEVVAVGPGKWDNGKFIETTIKVGQQVIFHLYPSGAECEDNGQKYTILAERQVVGVITTGK
jgi:chaperonin GroES